MTERTPEQERKFCVVVGYLVEVGSVYELADTIMTPQRLEEVYKEVVESITEFCQENGDVMPQDIEGVIEEYREQGEAEGPTQIVIMGRKQEP